MRMSAEARRRADVFPSVSKPSFVAPGPGLPSLPTSGWGLSSKDLKRERWCVRRHSAEGKLRDGEEFEGDGAMPAPQGRGSSPPTLPHALGRPPGSADMRRRLGDIDLVKDSNVIAGATSTFV